MGRREENEKLIRELYNDKDPLWTDIKEAERDFPVYIFYKNTPGGRRFVCTACGEYELQSIARTVYPEEAEALAAGHNENGICPRCRRRAMYKNEGKAKSGSTLRDSRNVAFVYPRGEELCLIVCVCLYRIFDPLARDAVRKFINTVYVLRTGHEGYVHIRVNAGDEQNIFAFCQRLGPVSRYISVHGIRTGEAAGLLSAALGA